MPNINNDGLKIYYQAVDGASSLTVNQWYTNSTKHHAFSVGVERDAIDPPVLKPEQVEQATKVITTFSDIATRLENTKIVANGDGSEHIELELPDRIITMLIDQSGSMTWNDNKGLRHTVARRMVERMAATYPGQIRYNLVKFGGLPVNVTLFGVIETNELQQSDLQSTAANFFEDNENKFAGIRIIRKEGSYPTSPIDGSIIQEGFFTKIEDIDLTEGEQYYYGIYTFDKDYLFSKGSFIHGAPRVREIPRGVAKVSTDILSGTGLIKDQYSAALWHFGEGSGSRVFDFTANQDLIVSDDIPVWLQSTEVPVGRSGLRFNGLTTQCETTSVSPNTAWIAGNSLTLMAWVYPYDGDKRVIFTQGSLAGLNYALLQDTGGYLVFKNSVDTRTSTDPLTPKQWNHVAVVITDSAVEFYINGVSAGSGALSNVDTTNATHTFAIGVDQTGTLGTFSNFFGKITEVSIHTTARSQPYINDAANPIVEVVNPNADVQGQTVFQDNGDRLVLINYDVPSDYDYDKILIVRNDLKAPSWEEDGDQIALLDASPGKHIFTDAYSFAANNTYYYRLWTKNSLGNYSYRSDSPLLTVAIPKYEAELPALNPPLTAVFNAVARAGNRKVWLTWDNAVLDDRIAFVEIYYSSSQFPAVGDKPKEGNEGNLIFKGHVADGSFVHRDIDNAISAYYTIVNRDRYGRASGAVKISAIPLSNADESGFPLLEVEDLSWEIVNNQSLSVSFKAPVDFKANLKGYLDQRVILYGAITDEFGSPVSDDTNISMTVTAKISTRNQASDVLPNESQTVQPTDKSLYTFTSTRASKGVIKGALSMVTNTTLLSQIESAEFSIQIYSYVNSADNPNEKVFEFYSAPVTVSLVNPFKMKLINRDNRMVSEKCPIDTFEVEQDQDSSVQDITFQETSVDGAYVRSTNPFVVRVELSYRDQPLTVDTKIQVASYDATLNICNGTPSIIQQSTTVLPPATTLDVQTGLQDILDADGNPTGEKKVYSYVDIPLTVPRQPQGAMLFVQCSYDGYFSIQNFYIIMQNILRIELTAKEPIADGRDIAEQLATVYMIDPDYPNDSSRRIPVPDYNIVGWRLGIEDFGENRPFYSTDAIPSLGGVRSYIQGGVARHVFFGPAAGVIWHAKKTKSGSVKYVGERYRVYADIVYDGLSANDNKPLQITPLGGAKNRFGSRFLMEFPAFKNVLWADGEDWARLVISRRASTPSSLSNYSNCFMSCALAEEAELIDMSPGQVVNVYTLPDFEILWGDDVYEEVDPYTGKLVLHVGENANKARGVAYVEMKDADETLVYFRINKYFPPQTCATSDPLQSTEVKLINPCECLGITGDDPVLLDQCSEYIVGGGTSILLNGEARPVRGGGAIRDGVPPTILVPQEPLSIRVVGLLADGVPSNSFVVDGKTINEIVLQVSFSDEPVPDGVPIAVSIKSELDGGLPAIKINNRTLFTVKETNSYFDSINAKSYVYCKIEPVASDTGINETVFFDISYDKSGTVQRSKSTCATISYDPNADKENEISAINNIFSNKLYGYNTLTDTWEEFAPMLHPRAGLIIEGYNGSLYAIGGLDQSTISQINEHYDINTDVWTDVSIMPTARFCMQSVRVSSKIYVIGGVTIDANTGALTTSTACEVYDTANDTWAIKADMPTVDNGTAKGARYGVAFGLAFYMNVSGEDRIYVLCGVTSLNSKGNVASLNDRILYYSIPQDKWFVSSLLTGDDATLYKRISAEGFVDGSKIIVSGGANVQFANQYDTTGKLIYLASTFAFTPLTETLVQNDADFTVLPRLRYKAGSVSLGTNHYMIGGSDSRSQTLNVFEKISSSASPYVYSNLPVLPAPMTMIATSSVTTTGGVNYIMVCGGIGTGRPPGFLQITTKFGPTSARLDGKQTVGLSINLADGNGDIPTRPIKVIVRGYVNFRDSAGKTTSNEALEMLKTSQSTDAQKSAAAAVDRRLAVYPVLFSTQEMTLTNGEGMTTLLARSDDVLQALEDLARKAQLTEDQLNQSVGDISGEGLKKQDTHVVIRSGENRQPYAILVQITVVDDFYFGQTTEDLSSLLSEQDAATFNASGSSSNNIGQINSSTGGTVSQTDTGRTCTGGADFKATLSWEGYSEGINIQNQSAIQTSASGFSNLGTTSSFSLLPKPLGQLASPVVPYFIDIDWIPTIDVILENSDATAETILQELRNIENTIPFGGSALFDSLLVSARFLSKNELHGIGKVLYVMTDNENNMSLHTLQEAIDEINAIDGYQKVPVIIGNFSVVYPITLSAKANITDTRDLNKIVKQTKGQSLTVLSDAFTNDLVGIFAGEAIGSLGYGEFELFIDLKEKVKINQIETIFQLYDNTNGRWKILISSDGYVYTDLRELYKANATIDFSNLEVRYIKIEGVLVTGFTASNDPYYETIPLPASPTFNGVTVYYDNAKRSFIYLNTQRANAPAQQVVVAVDATKVDPKDIQVGIAKSTSHNWLDYQKEIQPSVAQDGKIYIPIRFNTDNSPSEPLQKIDKYTYVAKNGRWNPESTVTIFDHEDKVVDSSLYKLYPRDGLVVFNQRQTSAFKMSVRNGDDFRVGMMLNNRSSQKPLEIDGVGLMFSTNEQLLPPAEAIPPVAKNVRMIQDVLYRYSKIEASYEYRDSNNDPEDKSQLEIQWFINGTRVPYLDNLTKWNDISDLNDPLWHYAFSFTPSDLTANISPLAEARKRNESILVAGDRVHFTIRVSDGDLRSVKVQSPTLEVLETSPEVSAIAVKGLNTNGSISNTITAETTAVVQFELLADSDVNNSLITWYVNSKSFKSGIYGQDENADRILPLEQSQTGEIALVMNNEIYCVISPETGASSGKSVTSDTVIVKNTIPKVLNVKISPASPRSGQNIVLTFTFLDVDVGITNDSTQSNQSKVKWYKTNSLLQGVWQEVKEFANDSIVAGTSVTKGDRWKAIVTPDDGLDEGLAVESNIVTVS